MASMPARSKSPALTSGGDKCASMKNSFLAGTLASPQLKVAPLAISWRGLSSKATNMPLAPWPCTAFTRHCSANTVLPAPGPPMIKLVRWRGRPPWLT